MKPSRRDNPTFLSNRKSDNSSFSKWSLKCFIFNSRKHFWLQQCHKVKHIINILKHDCKIQFERFEESKRQIYQHILYIQCHNIGFLPSLDHWYMKNLMTKFCWHFSLNTVFYNPASIVSATKNLMSVSTELWLRNLNRKIFYRSFSL